MKETPQEISRTHLSALIDYMESIFGRPITDHEVIAYAMGVARDVVESELAHGVLERGRPGLDEVIAEIKTDFENVLTGRWPLG